MTKAKTVESYLSKIEKKYKETDHHVLTPSGKKEMRFLLKEFVKYMNHEEVFEILEEYHIYLNEDLTFDGKKYVMKN